MRIREQVLFLLQQHRGTAVSGQEIAQKLSVSRGAVWKAVQQLRRDGCRISAATNSGYVLQEGDPLTAAMITSLLKTPGVTPEVYDSVTSTNDLARERGVAGAEEGRLIVARQQTAGRGRRGRVFFSPTASGLYMSLLLRPAVRAEEAVLMTTAAAVAVAETLEELSGRQTEIKWVNDIFLDGKKVCGILTEGAINLETGGLDYATLGIGVNLACPEGGFPDELNGIAGAVFPQADACLAAKTAAGITDRFFGYYGALEDRLFLPQYRERSMLLGQTVVFPLHGTETEATAVAIDENCGLCVRLKDGQEKTLSSGEVSVQKKQIH